MRRLPAYLFWPLAPILLLNPNPAVRRTRHVLFSAFTFLISATAAAQAPPTQKGPSFDLVVELGAEWGGDRVGEVTFTDGDTQAMYAGQGITGAVGVVVRPRRDAPLGLRATAGLKWTPTAADNANIMLTRLPFEVVGTYGFTKDVWAGAGYVHHARVRFNGDGFGPDMDFEGAHGATVEVGWRWAALTYTTLGYTDEAGTRFDASSIGVSGVFPILRR